MFFLRAKAAGRTFVFVLVCCTAGRYHTLSPDTNRPLGTYTAIIKGLGTFNMQYGTSLGDVTLPNARTKQLPASQGGGYITYLDVPVTSNDSDIELTILAQNATAPISSFKLYAPGCCNSAAGTCSSTCLATFNPTYLGTLSGFKGFRTMDWQDTNNAVLADFADRATRTSITQDRPKSKVFRIRSVTCYNPGQCTVCVGEGGGQGCAQM